MCPSRRKPRARPRRSRSRPEPAAIERRPGRANRWAGMSPSFTMRPNHRLGRFSLRSLCCLGTAQVSNSDKLGHSRSSVTRPMNRLRWRPATMCVSMALADVPTKLAIAVSWPGLTTSSSRAARRNNGQSMRAGSIVCPRARNWPRARRFSRNIHSTTRRLADRILPADPSRLHSIA